MTSGRHRASIAVVALVCAVLATPVAARDSTWHAVEVPGGRATLSRLGVPESRERSAVMIDLIRRLHFSTDTPSVLLAALRQELLRPPALSSTTLFLPSPLPPGAWSEVIFGREVPASRLFAEILNDERARLLFHGLAGLDSETRQWFQAQPELLRALYRQADAVRSFALFAPALKVTQGRVAIPGGPEAARQWSAVLDAAAGRPDGFARRLFTSHSGRAAGLYFVFTQVDDARRAFLLGTHASASGRDRRFQRLVAGFTACYPPQSTAYPFAVRSPDPALLLVEAGLTAEGRLAGPADRRLWEEVLAQKLRRLPASSEASIDAAWVVDAFCGALAEDRAAVFAALLAGQRVFAGVTEPDRPELVEALRARLNYPALFIALEQAGSRRARVFAAAARHASRLAAIDNAARSITALRQFQGALMITLDAAAAGSLTAAKAESLVESLAAVAVDNQGYGGRIADWLTKEWLPAMRAATSSAGTLTVEDVVAAGLAGSAAAPMPAVHWEGRDYLVDIAGTARQRLSGIRGRQGGVLLDHVLALQEVAAALRQPPPAARLAAIGAELDALAPHLRLPGIALEYENDGPDVATVIAGAVRSLRQSQAAGVPEALAEVVDFLVAHVLPAWAYAPHLGGADSGALAGGDGSLRHRLGVRVSGRSRATRRWELAVSPAARGSVEGSIVGVQAALASWSLRRLSSNAVPAAPAIDSNDLVPLTLTAALMNPRLLRDADLAHLAAVQARGAEVVAQSSADPADLERIAAVAAMSPWTRAALPWMLREEPDRIAEQFSPLGRARLGGLRLAGLDAWGSVTMMPGALSPAMPRPLVQELFAGRPADGIVGGRSIDLTLRVAAHLADLELPAALAAPVLAFAMRDHLDRVRPFHPADAAAFARQARLLTRLEVEDYVGAVAAIGPLRPARQ